MPPRRTPIIPPAMNPKGETKEMGEGSQMKPT